MAKKTNIYLIGINETSNFEKDIYCMNKIKILSKCNVKLNAVFAGDFEPFPGVKKYCSLHKIDLVNIFPEDSGFVSVIQYSVSNLDKKNLAALISEKKISNLNWFFKQDKDFFSQII